MHFDEKPNEITKKQKNKNNNKTKKGTKNQQGSPGTFHRLLCPPPLPIQQGLCEGSVQTLRFKGPSSNQYCLPHPFPFSKDLVKAVSKPYILKGLHLINTVSPPLPFPYSKDYLKTVSKPYVLKGLHVINTVCPSQNAF